MYICKCDFILKCLFFMTFRNILEHCTPQGIKMLMGLKVLTRQVKSDGGGETTRRRRGGDTKKAGMQRVNLLKSPLPMRTKGAKSEGGGAGGVAQRVRRRRSKDGGPFPQPSGSIVSETAVKVEGWEEGTRRRGEWWGSGPRLAWSSKRLRLCWTLSPTE